MATKPKLSLLIPSKKSIERLGKANNISYSSMGVPSTKQMQERGKAAKGGKGIADAISRFGKAVPSKVRTVDYEEEKRRELSYYIDKGWLDPNTRVRARKHSRMK